MRLDKYIWIVRLFKTRSLAAKACQAGQVKLNDAVCKASKDVNQHDIISIRTNPIWKTYNVLEIPKSRIGSKLVGQNLQETTSTEDLELLKVVEEQNRLNRFIGQKGRPTKKQRRDLDNFI